VTRSAYSVQSQCIGKFDTKTIFFTTVFLYITICLLWNSQICYRVGVTVTPYTVIREVTASNRDGEIRYPQIHHANSTTEPLSRYDRVFANSLHFTIHQSSRYSTCCVYDTESTMK